MMLENVRRRREWVLEGATPRQLTNLALAGAQFALRREPSRCWPVIVKIDISPLCNLRCTYCVHARPGDDPILQDQVFKRDYEMSVAQFEKICGEIGGRTMTVALYYLGDPLMHPDLADICRIAANASLKSHVSTNFSFRLTDEDVAALVHSGLTHLTVCVDGMAQERYERTRVGGRIDRVLGNLDRLLAIRRAACRQYPKVEVQFIRYQHNIQDVEEAARWCADRGVDQFTEYWGNLHNYADINPDRLEVLRPRERQKLPLCTWPYFSMVIKSNGDVIPCCYHRAAEQYRGGRGDDRAVGNVFRTSVMDVWNSREYRSLRGLVANPRRARDDEFGDSFCDGCSTVYELSESHVRTAATHSWEDLYERDRRGVVVRRPSDI